MVQLVLTDDQTQVIYASVEPVEIVDAAGNRVALLDRAWTPEEIAEAERLADSDGPWFTTTEVLEHLNSLGKE